MTIKTIKFLSDSSVSKRMVANYAFGLDKNGMRIVSTKSAVAEAKRYLVHGSPNVYWNKFSSLLVAIDDLDTRWMNIKSKQL